MKKREKFQELSEQWLKLQGQVRKECIKFLKRVLKANNNHLEWDDTELDCSVTLSFNGGNHPEYASNVYSTLQAIDMNDNGDITFEIEDCPDYDIDYVLTCELYDVCDFVDNVLLPTIK